MSDYRKLDQDARKAIAATEETPAEVLEQLAQVKTPKFAEPLQAVQIRRLKRSLKLGK